MLDIIAIILLIILISLVGVLLARSFIKKDSSQSSTEDIRKSVSGAFAEMSPHMLNALKENNSAFLEKVESEIKHLKITLEDFSKILSDKLTDMNSSVEKNLSELRRENSEKLDTVQKTVNEKLENIQKAVDLKLSELRRENSEKLESIQKTVDEKLDQTLSTRLKDSFENVIKQIGEVNKTIGEIKGLANDVGSLNRVLTNVKTKGIVGEVILGNIISEILTKAQYDENVVTRKGSADPVEFAIKMPGKDDGYVYLPVDSKFPLETYYKIKDAVDNCDKNALSEAKKELRQKLKTYAKDISKKYIDPPNTTDFAIMFLPIEGLYIEAIDMGLFEELQREFKISIAGPSTLTALLNSLQMGFKSLEIQKHSSEVFTLLSAVKTEFEKFAGVLQKAQKKVDEASNEISTLVGTRTNAINRKLKNITYLDDDEAKSLLELDNVDEI
ncbi:MAG: DNA recombination protein RmuC [Clostridia bacterium]|nr:DNA recombination protein RmuC [Clostridia bacterium]